VAQASQFNRNRSGIAARQPAQRGGTHPSREQQHQDANAMGCGGTACSQGVRLLKHQCVATRTSRAAITSPLRRNCLHGQTQTPRRPIHKGISAAGGAVKHRMNEKWTRALQQRNRHSLNRPIEMPTTGSNHYQGMDAT